MTTRTFFFLTCLMGFSLISACGGNSDDDPTSVRFTKTTTNEVNYTLGSEQHTYKEGSTYFGGLGTSSSIGARSRYDYSFAFGDFSENIYFEITTGTLTNSGTFLPSGYFYDFLTKGSYSYGLDTLNPGISMVFADGTGTLWYTDSVNTQSGSFEVTDTIGFIGPDLYPYKKIKANFSCDVATSKGASSKKITDGSMVVVFGY